MFEMESIIIACNKTYLLVAAMINDHFKIAVLIAMALIIFLIKDLFLFILRCLGEIPNYLVRLFAITKTKIRIRNHLKKNSDMVRVESDIDKNLAKLDDADDICIALQFFLKYPSKRAFNKIFCMAMNEKDYELQTFLVCLMCDALKNNSKIYE